MSCQTPGVARVPPLKIWTDRLEPVLAGWEIRNVACFYKFWNTALKPCCIVAFFFYRGHYVMVVDAGILCKYASLAVYPKKMPWILNVYCSECAHWYCKCQAQAQSGPCCAGSDVHHSSWTRPEHVHRRLLGGSQQRALDVWQQDPRNTVGDNPQPLCQDLPTRILPKSQKLTAADDVEALLLLRVGPYASS